MSTTQTKTEWSHSPLECFSRTNDFLGNKFEDHLENERSVVDRNIEIELKYKSNRIQVSANTGHRSIYGYIECYHIYVDRLYRGTITTTKEDQRDSVRHPWQSYNLGRVLGQASEFIDAISFFEIFLGSNEHRKIIEKIPSGNILNVKTN